jgi:hypothetical protein
MSNHEPADPTKHRSPGHRRNAYHPGIVMFVITAALVIGVLLKTNSQQYRIAINPTQQVVGENVNPTTAD